jgi:hypothetical protein
LGFVVAQPGDADNIPDHALEPDKIEEDKL